MLKKGKKKKEEAEKKTASDAEKQGKVSESDSAGAEANPGELISNAWLWFHDLSIIQQN